MDSRAIASSQQDIHPDLDTLVRKHLATPYRKPLAEHSCRAFDQVQAWLAQRPSRPLVLDSCCGVGQSTAALARLHPEAWVIGVDKSAHRLAKHGREYAAPEVDNYCVIRADLNDFWRLAGQAGWQLSHHYLLYPNPWPKKAHLKRRWHGAPVLPAMLALGGKLELRSNWSVYVAEFQRALALAGYPGRTEQFRPQVVLTPFERKYLHSGHTLFRCLASLGPTGATV